MATQTIIFEGSAQRGERRTNYRVFSRSFAVDDHAGLLELETNVDFGDPARGGESFTTKLQVRFENPTFLSVATGALGGVGLCIAARWTGALMEAIYKASDATRPKGRSSWRSMEERADAVARHLRQNRKDLEGKFVGALAQCVFPRS